MMHLLTGTELQRGDLLQLLETAEQLRQNRAKGELSQALRGKTLALMFEKPSLRTHLSFSVAMRELGGSDDYREGVAAFMGKRPPSFTGR